MTPVLEASGLAKTYVGGDGSTIEVLRGLDFVLEPAEFVAILGASGSGKSTLLHLLGALDLPTGGSVRLEGQPLADRTPVELAALRNRRIGFVFQFHHLLRDFSALENAAMPLLIGQVAPVEARERAEAVLGALGLAERLHHFPGQLSGGEQQRVAVARSLVTQPVVVLADEPSGNLDPTNADSLHELFGSVRQRFGTALVVATHNRNLARRADRILRLEHGVLIPDRHDWETAEA